MFINAYQKISRGKNQTTFDDYKILLKNIGTTTRRIHFTGFTEPLLNPEWYNIMKYTIDSGYRVVCSTTLYQATAEDAKRLAQLNVKVGIHLTDSSLHIDPQIYQEFIRWSGRKIILNSFTKKGQQRALKICQDKKTKHRPKVIQNRAGNLPQGVCIIHEPVRCSENRQYSNVVLPNGDVVLCCQDFGLTQIIGNLFEATLQEIHHSERMHEILKEMNSSQNDSFICKQCSYYARRLQDV